MATNDELVEIAQLHPHAEARACAFSLLVDRNDKRCKDLLLATLRDTSMVMCRAYDMLWNDCVCSYNVDVMFNSKNLTESEKEELDSVLLFTPNLWSISRIGDILRHLPAEEKYYDRVRDIYCNEQNTLALMALANYRLDADKPLIIKALMEFSKGYDKLHRSTKGETGGTNQALAAVRRWPDADFMPALIKLRDYELKAKYYDYSRIRLFYDALMAYDDQRSYDIIDETLSKAEGRNNGYTFEFHSKIFKAAVLDGWPKTQRYMPLIEKHQLQDVDVEMWQRSRG
ncbi:MAG: hypothetical protein IJ808_08845 [Muribaculaceae bacterium]|nr:hypothetical protein [Muribaculaceae bacterium]